MFNKISKFPFRFCLIVTITALLTSQIVGFENVISQSKNSPPPLILVHPSLKVLASSDGQSDISVVHSNKWGFDEIACTPDEFKALGKDGSLKHLSLHGGILNEKQLKAILEIKSLESLKLIGVIPPKDHNVLKAGLGNLEALESLKLEFTAWPWPKAEDDLLAGAGSLKCLNIECHNNSGKMLRMAAKCPNLEELALAIMANANTVEATDIESLAKLKKLKTLKLGIHGSTEDHDGAIAKVLGTFKNLEHLELQFKGHKGFDVFSKLAKKNKLKSLMFTCAEAGVSDSIGNCTNLESLIISHNKVKFAGETLAFLTKLKELNHLQIAGAYNIYPIGKHLKKLTNLKSLQLDDTYGGDEIIWLRSLSNLESLELSGIAMDDLQFATPLQNKGSLKRLKLVARDFGPELGKSVAAMTNLEYLEIFGARHPNYDFPTIFDGTAVSKLTKLHKFKASNVELDAAWLKNLVACKGLKHLEIESCLGAVSVESYAEIAKFSSLETLIFKGEATNMMFKRQQGMLIIDVSKLGALKKLTRLCIHNSTIDEKSIVEIAKFESLVDLDLQLESRKIDAIKPLYGLKNLRVFIGLGRFPKKVVMEFLKHKQVVLGVRLE